MRKILVIRGGAIGDFILTLPVLAALQRKFPDASLELLADKRYASLAIESGFAQDAFALNSPKLVDFFAPNGSKDRVMADYFAKFDLIVSYLFDPDRTFESNIAACSSAKFIAGPHRPDDSADIHATEILLRPLEELGITGADSTPRLKLRDPSMLPSKKSRQLVLHPGSGSELKNWPEPKWRELLRILSRETSWSFLLVGGEAEGSRCERLASLLPTERVELAVNLPLLELARDLDYCIAFIGHDSGITHLAAAVGLPGLTLWGPSADTVWRPKSKKITLLKEPGGLSHLKVETVRKAITAIFETTQYPEYDD
ncbi:MAG TPA: glycosyltransferase family 9 protein [Verrucomicrobiae bacterium]|jgi:ADP-heptose:LPS heptosyltransferase